MKKQLIELSDEKGFSARYMTTSDKFYYLWMWELHKWLMDELSIFVEPSTYLQENTIDYKFDIAFMYEIVDARQNISKRLPIVKDKFSSWKEALEEGLFEALKLIQK